MPMNSYYCEDLQDYYNNPFDKNNQQQWLREELRLAATNQFDHLIVEGYISNREMDRLRFQRLIVHHDEQQKQTIFSGWAQTKNNGKRVLSLFLQETIEKDNKLYVKQLAKSKNDDDQF